MHLLKYNIHLPSEGHSWWVLGTECQLHHLVRGAGWLIMQRTICNKDKMIIVQLDKTRPRTAVTTRRKSTNLMRGQKRGDKHWNDVGEWLSLASKELRIDDTALVAHNKVKRTRSLTTRKRGQGQLLSPCPSSSQDRPAGQEERGRVPSDASQDHFPFICWQQP